MGVIVHCPSSGTSLDPFELVDIGLCMRVKYGASILKLWADQGLICTLFNLCGLYLNVSLDKAKRSVGLGCNLVYMGVP